MADHVVAVVQHPPVLLDRSATLRRGVELVEEAAAAGARLVTFPEAWVPGYPEWIWHLRPREDYQLTHEFHRRLVAEAVDLERDDLKPLREAARRLQVTVVVGIDERDGKFGRASVYNTAVMIGPDGEVLNRHRKLMPTGAERMVWGIGDGSGLRVVATPAGRVGALLCWENLMPLARYAIYSQGPEIYVAPTWACGEGWLASMSHIAQEGRCWVLGSGTAMRGRDVPESFPERDRLFPDLEEWFNAGDSVIVAPSGEVVAGPLHEEHGILYAECDPARVAGARRTFDVVGHYSRPDVFRFEVDQRPRTPVQVEE
jgi:nitrilase